MKYVLLFCSLFSLSCFAQNDQRHTKISKNDEQLEIVRQPEPYPSDKLKSLSSFPKNDDNNPLGIDFRMYDLSTFNLKDHEADLKYATFDSKTLWPKNLPSGFNPKEIMELGKNPGLGVRSLHKKGITGKNVGIAIIDQALLVNHIEYKNVLKMYEEILWFNPKNNPRATMHGLAVASIAVGQNIGVAPEASLYFIAESNTNPENKIDYNPIAQSIDRILQINRKLPADKKIKVISISRGFSPNDIGYKELIASIEKAKVENIFVVSCSLNNIYGFNFQGLGRKFMGSPDKISSYIKGLFWKNYKDFDKLIASEKILLVPMDNRTTAGPTGDKDYAYYADGGLSWAVPYIAGLYALAVQVKPEVSPKEFWDTAMATGDTITTDSYKLGKIVNPAKIIETLQKK